MGKNLHRHFYKHNLQMTKSHMKSCSIAVNEIQIKTIIRYDIIPTGWLK
jgi:hypothetical protein